jgi:hypothetical protein
MQSLIEASAGELFCEHSCNEWVIGRKGHAKFCYATIAVVYDESVLEIFLAALIKKEKDEKDGIRFSESEEKV